MKKEFLNFLCCPVCNSELTLNTFDESNGKIKTGSLVCKSNKNSHIFKIENYIPRFVRSSKYADTCVYVYNINIRCVNSACLIRATAFFASLVFVYYSFNVFKPLVPNSSNFSNAALKSAKNFFWSLAYTSTYFLKFLSSSNTMSEGNIIN